MPELAGLRREDLTASKHGFKSVALMRLPEAALPETSEALVRLPACALDFIACLSPLYYCIVEASYCARVQHSAAYDPIKRRTEVEKQPKPRVHRCYNPCTTGLPRIRLTGRLMKFPTWMQYDKEERGRGKYRDLWEAGQLTVRWVV